MGKEEVVLRTNVENEPSSIEAVQPKRRWRFQYSLRTLTLACLLAGAVLLLILTEREVKKLRAENKALREQVGVLTIEDPDKVHVLALKTLDEYTWRWRIYLPGGDYDFWCEYKDIPNEGYPLKKFCRSTAFGKQPGEINVDVTIRKDEKNEWMFKIVLSRESIKNTNVMPIANNDALKIMDKIMDVENYNYISCSGEKKTEVFDKNEQIELLRLRTGVIKQISPRNFEINPDHNPCPGILVWIEKAK